MSKRRRQSQRPGAVGAPFHAPEADQDRCAGYDRRSFGMGRRVATHDLWLSRLPSVIRRLKALDLSHDETEQRLFARDIFLFSYLMAGINFRDVACLRYSDIQDGRLVYARHKTRKEMNCRINTEAQTIIDKYTNIQTIDNYLFPILNPTVHKTERQRKERIKKVLKSVNGELRKIGNELGLLFPLTTYVARHSYASVLKHAGVDIALISQSLGHSDIATTQIYLDSFGDSRIDEAMTHLI